MNQNGWKRNTFFTQFININWNDVWWSGTYWYANEAKNNFNQLLILEKEPLRKRSVSNNLVVMNWTWLCLAKWKMHTIEKNVNVIIISKPFEYSDSLDSSLIHSKPTKTNPSCLLSLLIKSMDTIIFNYFFLMITFKGNYICKTSLNTNENCSSYWTI